MSFGLILMLAVEYFQEGVWSSPTAFLGSSVLICKVRGLGHPWFPKLCCQIRSMLQEVEGGHMPSLLGCSSNPPSPKPLENSGLFNTLSLGSLLEPCLYEPCCSKCAPWTSDFGITSDLVRNGQSRADPRPGLEQIPQWFVCTVNFDKHCS